MADVQLYVVDASVAAKWFLRDEDHVATSLRVREDFEDGLTRLIAPDFIRQEVASALSKAPRRVDRPKRPTYDQAWQSVLDFDALEIELFTTVALRPAAFSTAARYEC